MYKGSVKKKISKFNLKTKCGTSLSFQFTKIKCKEIGEESVKCSQLVHSPPERTSGGIVAATSSI